MDWYYLDGNRAARRLILATVIIILITFQLKIAWGFWFDGIPGWSYAELNPQLQTTLPAPHSKGQGVNVKELSFLKAYVREENAAYLPHGGYLTGDAMFLHFRNGAVLPANDELTGFVFPEYVFPELYPGLVYEELEQPRLFWDIVQSSLQRRTAGRRFLLPSSIGYPAHAPYMNIPYETYPSADTLEKISLWSLTIFIAEDFQVEVVSAREKTAIYAE